MKSSSNIETCKLSELLELPESILDLPMPNKPTYEELEQRIKDLETIKSERNKAEEALRESENQFRSLMEQSPMTISIMNPNGHINRINTAFRDFWGISCQDESELFEKYNILEDEQVRNLGLMPIIEKAFTGEEVIMPPIEYDSVKTFEDFDFKDSTSGEKRWIQGRLYPVKNKKGELMNVVLMEEDITDRIHAVEQLQSSEEQFRSLVEQSPVAVMILAPNGRLKDVNASYMRLWGINHQNLQDVYEKYNLLEDEQLIKLGVMPLIKKAFAGESIDLPQTEYDAQKTKEAIGLTEQEGEKRWIQTHLYPVKDKNANVMQVVLMMEDISENVLAKEALKKAHDELEQKVIERTKQLQQEINERIQIEKYLNEAKQEAEIANIAKSDFLSHMSHELRTPLNAILGFAQLSERDPDISKKQLQNIEIINRSGSHLLELINNILDVAKIEAGQVQLNKRSFDFYETLVSIKDMIGVRAKKKALDFTIDYDSQVPQYIKGDEHRLRQILLNILGNAVKFTEQGTISLKIDSREESQLFFKVTDQGIGIDYKDVETLFDPFSQVSNGQEIEQGTGLGLAISQKLIKLMNGNISVESKVGEGSTFSFEIEVEPIKKIDIPAKTQIRKVIGLEPLQPEYRILIVEDDNENRLFLSNLLKLIGFNIQEATNGLEGVETCNAWQPDLIFMDIRMPKVDGFEATRRIKANTNIKTPVIIATTASAFEDERKKVISAGCDDFIRKPIQETAVFDTIAQHLNVKFTYKDTKNGFDQAQLKSGDFKILTEEELFVFPDNILIKLKEAAKLLNQSTILKIIEEVRQQGHDSIADRLEILARDYKFNVIKKLIPSRD